MNVLPVLPERTPAATRIPRILHMVWVGSWPPPAWVQDSWRNWRMALNEGGSDWVIRRWTDAAVASSMRSLPEVAKRHGLNARGLADLVRIMAVSLWGGVYMDSDTIPLQPLEEWVGDRPAWVATSAPEAPLVLENARFGFPPGHPFLLAAWAVAERALQRGVRNEHFVAGPRAFRAAHHVEPWVQTPAWELLWTTSMAQAQRLIEDYPASAASLRVRFPATPVIHVSGRSAR